ncbi:MAG TPA: HAMP domain-containing sensor histidine kinase [Kofleriaceae bacterium]|nr:HAMP domain-containing sensor histidine kinase [Kofleriaceae bacterium]
MSDGPAARLLLIRCDAGDQEKIRRARDGGDLLADIELMEDAELATIGPGYDCLVCAASSDDALPGLVRSVRANSGAPILALAGVLDDELRRALRSSGATDSIARDELSPAALGQRLGLLIRVGRAEARLASALADARDASRSRDDFIRLVSHDLRGPLSTIHLGCDALGPEVGDGPGKAYIGAIERGVDRARAFLDSQLDLAMLQSGTLTVTAAPTDLSALLERVRVAYADHAARARCRLQVSAVSSELRAPLDRSLVERAVGLLITTAIGRAPRGSITLAAEATSGVLVISVHDDGTPIVSSQLPHAFDPTWQGPNGDGRLELGAALVKAVAEAHGGHATVASASGEGTRFELRLATGA